MGQLINEAAVMDKLSVFTKNSQGADSPGYSINEARGVSVFEFDKPTKKDLQTLPTVLIGGVDLSTRGATSPYVGVRRTMPLPHPWSNSLVVTSVTGIRGIGQWIRSVGGFNSQLGVKIPDFPLYPAYEIGVEYGAPIYQPKADSFIKSLTGSYVNYLGVNVPFKTCNEWIRFVSWKRTEETNVISKKTGMMFYATSDDMEPGASTPTGASQYPAAPYQALPDSIILMKWHQVPYSYITSPRSFISNCPHGVLNQFDFYDAKGDGDCKWKAGALRYGGVTVEDYRPPIPPEITNLLGMNLGTDDNKLVDITFTFYETNRQRLADRLPSPESVGAGVNKNWLIKGWNLQPYLNKPNRYFYSHTIAQGVSDDPADKTKWYPHHFSFPFELFFMDPELAQPDGFAANAIEVKP